MWRVNNVIKVLHIVLGLQVGGLEKFVLDLIDKYSSDIKPIIVCLEGKGELGQKYDHLGIVELHKEPGISLKIIRQLVVLMNEFDIDIIHTHNPGPHFYGAMAGFLTHRPVIHTKHGRNYPTDKKKVWLNKLSSLLTQRIVPVSQNAANVCIDIEKIPSTKIAVILNGVDTDLFCQSGNIVDDANSLVRIGIVARLSAEKDHQTLLSACKHLVEQTSDFHLEIIGDGPLRSLLENTVKILGLDEHVSFSGTRHDVQALLRQLDIFVLSSTTEGISLTLLEAMATELPVVATDVGGNPEVVIEGETGFLVPPQNPKAMAEKLLFLINDMKLRQKMGKSGRERVIANFSIRETARKYEGLYIDVLSKR
jgi:sugar transferase (PEP-CTERM/EpsH1 system associated)